MPTKIQAPRIESEETPRIILAADFKSLGHELPIRGGWGYTIEDAVVIDKNDPVVFKAIPFDGVGLEYAFVEKRIYEELIIFRPKEDRFSGIKWKCLKQELTWHNGRAYDVLTFEVTAFPDKDWSELKAEWESPSGYGSEGFEVDAHMRRKDSRMILYVTEYWFDITSFYGSELKDDAQINPVGGR
jgi:hypothetical protein